MKKIYKKLESKNFPVEDFKSLAMLFFLSHF